MQKSFNNANFHRISKGSVHESSDPAYLAYRRAWEELPQKRLVAAFPLHLDIESTSRCNLRCTFCDKQPLLPGHETDMSHTLFQKIIDEGAEHGLCSIKLSYRGEPLLHPGIIDMVAYAKAKGILDVYFNTNGMLLTEKKAHGLVEAGLNRISISMEGTEAKPYEEQRLGASFDTVLKNIKTLRAVRDEWGVDYPKIRIQTVSLPWVDLKKYAAFWGELADEVAFLDFNDSINRTALHDAEFCCPQIWQRMTITCSGAILQCNNDDYQRSTFGNAGEMSILECWQSEALQTVRQAHRNGQSHTPAACADCAWRTTQILKLRKKTK